jgi:hypothetical protein
MASKSGYPGPGPFVPGAGQYLLRNQPKNNGTGSSHCGRHCGINAVINI